MKVKVVVKNNVFFIELEVANAIRLFELGEVERIKKLLNVFNWGADMNSRVLYTTTGWKIINAFYERRSLKRKSLKKGDVIKVWYKYPEDYFKIKINEYEKRLSCRGKLK